MFTSLAEAEQGAALLRAFAPDATTGVAERPEVPYCVTIESPGAQGYFPSWERIAAFLLAFYAPQHRQDIEALPEV